jgi:hypothetical protein
MTEMKEMNANKTLWDQFTDQCSHFVACLQGNTWDNLEKRRQVLLQVSGSPSSRYV